MNNWLSLKEASEKVGKSIPALRQAIKRGKLTGKKISGPTGDMWMIDPMSLGLDTVDPTIHNAVEPLPQGKNTGVNSYNLMATAGEQSFDKTNSLYERLIKEKDRLNNERGKHIDTLNILLGDFQQRIRLLQDDNEEMQNQFRRLPAPPEQIRKKWVDSEQKQDQFEKERNQLLGQVGNMQKRINELTDRNLELAGQGGASREELEVLREEVEQLKNNWQTAQKKAEKLEEKLNAASEDNQELTREIELVRETMKTSYRKASKTVEKLRDSIKNIAAEKDNLEQEKENIQKALSELWREKEEIEKQLIEERNRPWWKRLI